MALRAECREMMPQRGLAYRYDVARADGREQEAQLAAVRQENRQLYLKFTL